MSSNIERVAVLGAGVMGAQLAAHFSNAGIPSFLFDISQEVAEKGKNGSTFTETISLLQSKNSNQGIG